MCTLGVAFGMKYGVNMLVWTASVGLKHEPLFSRIRQWGFDGVEIFVSADAPRDAAAIKRLVTERGLECTTCTVLGRETNLISADAGTRRQGVEYLKRCIERTAELGGRILCGPLYAGLGVMTGRRRTEREWAHAIEGLSAAAVHGRDLGVTLCLEPLNRFETYFLNTLEDAARLVRETGESNVRVHFDTFHSNIEEKQPASSLRAVARELGHVHISENDRGVPGTGHVDWRGVFTALKEIGYDGWMTIESFAEPEAELAAAAAIWRDLAPSGDDLARRGLEFAKAMSREVGIE